MRTAELEDRSQAGKGSGWSWAALAAAFFVWVMGLPTLGLSIFLSPVSLLLTAIASLRSQRDAVFWIAFALNAMLLLGLIGLAVALLTGDASIGFD